MLKFDANIIGEPPATVTWKKDTEDISSKDDKSMIITNVPYNTKVVIRSVKRKDQGSYEVLAKNECGKDMVTVNLRVIDRPGPPEQLVASEITSQGCHLSWRRPKDDGGSPIQYYQVEKQDPDSGLWIPCGRSEDTQLDVKGLTAMKRYKFRVCAVNDEGESDPCLMADDVLAKLRGPRRARGDRAPAPGPASPAAAPSSAAAGGGELLARLERKRGRRRKATR